jgi:3-keto-disaccharide hydrolase
MAKRLFWLPLLLSAGLAYAAEHSFDFSTTLTGQTPASFRSSLTGQGKPGDWQVVLDEVAPKLAPLTAGVTNNARQHVLAQLSRDSTDEHFPLLVYEDETYGDFSFTTQFKTVKGVAEQMAGIAFRIQNETNYYVVRASSLGNTFRFYKVVNGQRGQLIGVDVPVAAGVWHELKVECKGNEIRCSLNGDQLIPTITDSSFGLGKIGFWTKSDSVSFFTGSKIVYTPREPSAQKLVRDIVAKYPKLLGLQVFVAGSVAESPRLIGTKEGVVAEKPEGKVVDDVIRQANTYYGKGKKSVIVTMPLRDRNGEVIAAARVVMSTFPGQTEKNALERAAPIVKEMQERIHSLEDLVE